MTYQRPELVLDGQQLRQARENLLLSQTQFAAAINAMTRNAGHECACTKRLVQKWESGEHRWPRVHYQRAIAAVTGVPYRSLCQSSVPLNPTVVSQQLEDIETELYHLGRRLAAIAKTVRYSEPSPGPGTTAQPDARLYGEQ